MTTKRREHADLEGLLQRLAESDGAPGHEEQVRRVIRRELEGRASSVRVSPLGSLYAVCPPTPGPRVLLMTHMDEVGFNVSHVDRDGFVWLRPAGRVDLTQCTGRPAHFADGLTGDLAVVTQAGVRDRILLDPRGDIEGASRLQAGDAAVFSTPLAREGLQISGKALDNRVGTAVVLEAARRVRRAGNQVLLAFTALGQVGHRAARAAAVELAPGLAIAVGMLRADDDRRHVNSGVRVGAGPVVLMRGPDWVADGQLTERLIGVATSRRLRHQLALADEDTTGAAALQATQAGLATAALLIPCAGHHGPTERVDLQDVATAIELLAALLARPLAL